ncbi:SGNH/GDSL hydrolase family protein [Pontibacter sp. BT731]|uniref:SGNH/GDSL hydrolase family protein n=1 Tax=Pontibacter coccineus TaxID=3063328 RepID=UPI0026E1C946|nr:SGNH/GDSL hydrolase family protein [Pontibacter sp. BT731]MDO6390112.1 SGNH/GDSL hydrolase family protein [Pontibacter sp. BT731]
MKKLLSLLALLFTTASTQAQDWPNLKKYEASNQEIIASSKYPKAVFMGNSITEGWWQQRPEFFEKHGFAGRGIGGQTTPQMLIRFTPDVINLKPEVVVILAGTNDIAGNTGPSSVKMITDNLAAMAQLAKANGIKVVLSSILPVKEYPWSKDADAVGMIAQVNTWMKRYAAEQGFVYLDYFAAMADEEQGLKKEYSGDGVHPDLKGYAVMEPLVLKAVEDALKQGKKDPKKTKSSRTKSL